MFWRSAPPWTSLQPRRLEQVGTIHPLVAELDALRVGLGVPEQAVAEVTGTDAHEVSWWGIGLRTPSVQQTIAYAALLGRRIGFTDAGGEVVYVDQLHGDADDPVGRLMAVLEEHRDQLGWSRSRVAAEMGVSAAAASRWAAGKKPPSLASLTGYAAVLGWRTVLVVVDVPEPEQVPQPARGGPPKQPRSSARRRMLHPLVAHLEQTRTAMGVSQAQISRATGVHKNTVGRWSTGAKTPSVENLVDYARALGEDVFIGPLAEGPPPAPEAVRRGRILQEIDLVRGNRDLRRGGVPSRDDGTGPQWRQAAEEALAEEIRADCANRLTWAVTVRAVLARTLAVGDPADLRAEVLSAAAELIAWVEDLDARTGRRGGEHLGGQAGESEEGGGG
ncbi:helix-turn-helix transcriptional regulator [Streptosporangium sp. NPDC000563]|uniref:helix-turn-helix transcriptional regulator n=1 Tax=Streptosporangium sp. NPDC000563 TaxID=3154366 RepID=UPI0033287192